MASVPTERTVVLRRARRRAAALLATVGFGVVVLVLSACFDRATAPPSIAPVPRHDFVGDANWAVNKSLAAGSYEGTIDNVYGGAAPGPTLGPFVYPTFIVATVAGQVRQVPGALQGDNIVRDPYSTNDPAFWGSMGFTSNGDTWYPNGLSGIIRVVAPITPFRNPAGGQPTGDWNHCGWEGYALCWTWAGTAQFSFTRLHVDLTLTRTPDTTMWQGTSATFTAGMSQTTFPGNPYPVDMSGLDWRWLDDSLQVPDGQPCTVTSGTTCTHLFTRSGTMYVAAYVNGEAQQKTMHVAVKVPTLTLTADKEVVATPGDTATFTPVGNGPVVVQSWSFTPDSTGTESTSTSWGDCGPGTAICRHFVSGSGNVKVVATVNGSLKEARVHVSVVPCPTNEPVFDDPNLRLDLVDLINRSGPNLQPGSSQKRERAGDTQAVATECSVTRSSMDTRRSPDDVKVGIAHSHPTVNGDVIYGCPPDEYGVRPQRYPGDSGPIATKVPDATSGGGSVADWIAVAAANSGNGQAIDGYVINADGEVWKLPASLIFTPSLEASNNKMTKYKGNSNPSCNW
jgi:hypothetical protein